jgi:hypothetical protein
MSVSRKLPSVLQGSDETAFLDQEVCGVRFPGIERDLPCRGRGQRGSIMMMLFSSCLHI